MKHGQSIVTQTGSVEFHRNIYSSPNLSDRINEWTKQQLLYAENNNVFFRVIDSHFYYEDKHQTENMIIMFEFYQIAK